MLLIYFIHHCISIIYTSYSLSELRLQTVIYKDRDGPQLLRLDRERLNKRLKNKQLSSIFNNNIIMIIIIMGLKSVSASEDIIGDLFCSALHLNMLLL